MPSSGPAFVYVLPSPTEDLLKLGFSRDPLQRMQALHPRWFEFFDLERGFALEFERVAEARAFERGQHRLMRELRAPAPLTALRAAGAREWFRGAWPQVAPLAARHEAGGGIVHAPLAALARTRLEASGDLLREWTACLSPAELEAQGCAALATLAQRRALDVLDAYLAFRLPLSRWLPEAVLEWHASARRASGA